MMWAALTGAIVFEVVATLALRASEGFRKRIWIVPVAVGYLVSFYLLWLTLRLGMHVGIAYGVWTACGVALVAVAARVLFGEPLTWLMVVGHRVDRRRRADYRDGGRRGLSATASTITATPATGTTSSPTRRLVASAITPTTGGESTKPTRISQVTTVSPVPARSPGS